MTTKYSTGNNYLIGTEPGQKKEAPKPVQPETSEANPSGCTHSSGYVSKEAGRACIAAMLKSLRPDG